MKKAAHPVGTVVVSHFRARWRGVVVASGRDHVFHCIDPRLDLYKGVPVTRDNAVADTKNTNKPFHVLSQPNNVLVKVTHDKHDHPMRKPWFIVIDSGWLSIYGSKEN